MSSFAAVDTRLPLTHSHALDGVARKHEDFNNLVKAALHKAGSNKAILPTKSKKTVREIGMQELTRSKRQFVVEQVLEVTSAETPNTLFALLHLVEDRTESVSRASGSLAHQYC